MAENIKYHPLVYQMSEELKRFFTQVTNDLALQERLYQTETVRDVAVIANELGFKITGAEVIKAQAGRVLAILREQPEDVQTLLSGKKAKTGAQWGRGGNGYIDKPGFWLLELENTEANAPFELEIKTFLSKVKTDSVLKRKLISTQSFNDVAKLAKESAFHIPAASLLELQARKILSLSDEDAEKVAKMDLNF